MTKFKLIGATLVSALLIGLSPVEAAVDSQLTDRRNAGKAPVNGAALADLFPSQSGSIGQGSSDSGMTVMAAKKSAKKKKTKAS